MKAVIYARISADLGGQALGVARQLEDCTSKADSLDWVVSDTFVDNDVSASKDVPRPEYARMLTGIADGSINAVVVYDLDRLTRKPAELETFIDLTAVHGVALANVSGDVDLTTANGKMIARIKGAVARQEADRISERTTRQKQQRVQAGKPLGQRFRTFGYERDWSVIETEAKVVREVFKRAAAGESQNGITRDLRARGIKTATGAEWTAQQTSRMLKTPKYAGLQTYKGEVVGKSTVVAAFISEGEYEAVQHPSNGASFNFRKHILSGLLICDKCKAPMSGTRLTVNGREKARYRCDTRSGGCGSVSIHAAWVEDMVNRYMSSWVSIEYREDFEAGRDAAPSDNSKSILAIDERIDSIQVGLGDGSIRMEDALAALKVARSERGRLVREDAAAVKQSLDMAAPIRQYDAMTDDEKRVQIRKAFRRIFIRPGRRSRKFDEDRVWVMMTFDPENVRRHSSAVNVNDVREVYFRNESVDESR